MEGKVKNITVFGISIIVTLISNYFGHVNPPFSISFTPILIPLITSLLFFVSDIKLIPKFLSFILFVILNDLLIKNFAGGIHDSEGQAWISAFLSIGLLLSLIPVFIYFFTIESNKKKFILSAFVSAILIYVFMLFSSSFGRSWNIESSYNLKTSKENGLYVSDAILSYSIIVHKQDSFQINSAWIEYQERSIHNSIFRKKIITDNQILILKLDGKFEEIQFQNTITYKVVDPAIYGANYIDSLISVPFEGDIKTLDLNFYHSNRQLIKTITISKEQ
jgi:hypothetical protein